MTPPTADDDAIPTALTLPERRRGPRLIWLLPVVAVLVGAWLLASLVGQRGPTVTISFLTAEGIDPGKTRIRFKDVDIGEVKAVELAPDRSHVLVSAQLVKQAEAFLAEDSRFWVVRPRVSGGKVSGINTLLSGAYIGVDAGKSETRATHFKGLEVAPILTQGLPGRQFVLDADDIGSLDIGAPLFFRRVQVGEVVAHELAADGNLVRLKVFVRAPYDRFVKARTRFWNASGVDFSLDANGVRVQAQSLVSVVLGGIAFETPADERSVERILADWHAGKEVGEEDAAAADTHFILHPDRATAMKAPDGEPLLLTIQFNNSIRGLQAGAPVDFRGIVVGEVLSLGADYDAQRDWFNFPVRIALYTERIRLTEAVPGGKAATQTAAPSATKVRAGLLRAINERGLRAQLRSGSLITGQLYVALDFFPEAKPVQVSWAKAPLEMPAVRGDFEQFQISLTRLMGKLEQLPLDQIGKDVQTLIGSLDASLKRIDALVARVDGELAPELAAAIKDLRTTLSTAQQLMQQDAPVQQDLRETLREVSRAAQAVRTLSDTLEREPESLLRGKSEAAR